MSVDYKSTVFLPRTEFAMKARLPQREPELLERWAGMELFRRLREDAEGREKFILHDGPPYANGNIHIGTAMNKILKDVVNRSQQMMGKDADYVPGWDCHGLPIEWKIEEQYRAAGRDKDQVPIIEFRQECREFAEHWIDVQREEFKRLGIEGDWDNPYTTMTHAAEAQIVREILKFLMSGALFKGSKAVLWSVVEKTALAEAEVEYHDHKSTTVYVRFPIQRAAVAGLEGASVVIWTTTPWTIPGNRALACDGDADYLLVEVAKAAEGSLALVGERMLLARDLVMQAANEIGFTPKLLDVVVSGRELAGTLCRHPLHGQGYDFEVPLLTAGFVTMDQGTGFVHIAPGHGADDFELGAAHGLEVPETVDEGGLFYPHVPLFAGKHVFKASTEVADRLEQAERLLARGTLVHSYPHSWRSKAPLIFRNAPQWFISMSKTGLRETALAAIDEVRWVPPQGRNRIHGMIENRPDWVISRQRAWGVPIPVFVDKASGEPLRDEGVNQRIVETVSAEGADAWFASPPSRFLGDDHDPDDYEQVLDILDVWFESGSTHSFVLEDRPNLRWPASLYLEGSDQHRGWFHSSLLEACGTRGRAPYDAVLTHGFVMDGEGRKMSKSLGNTVAPQQVVDQFGADVLRLWVVSTDYSEDMRIGPEIIKAQVDTYRRLRNTLRFLLGNLADFEPEERLPYDQLPEIERWVLHRLTELDVLVRRCCNDFDFHAIHVALHNFCAVDLSAFYFDMRKDSLYCDPRAAPRRRAARTVLDELFSCLTAWLAPILCFTAEEAWLQRFPGTDQPGAEESVHLRQFPEPPTQWRDDGLVARWRTIRHLRRVVTGALEVERQAKRIGSSLQAHPQVYAGADYLTALDGQSLAEIAITSGVTLIEETPPEGAFTLEDVPGVGVVPGLAAGARCGRCWQVLGEVGERPATPDLCGRCADAVENAPG